MQGVRAPSRLGLKMAKLALNLGKNKPPSAKLGGYRVNKNTKIYYSTTIRSEVVARSSVSSAEKRSGPSPDWIRDCHSLRRIT